MLNKKQLFGSMLMFALLSSVCVNAMDGEGDAGAGTRRGRNSKSSTSTTSKGATAFDADDDDASTGHSHDEDAAGAGTGADAGAGKGTGTGTGTGTGAMAKIDGYVDMLNAPLKMAMTKITAFGAKSKLVVSLLLAYLGYSASGKVVDDVTSIPGTLKSFVGADCEESECRGAKDWTEAA